MKTTIESETNPITPEPVAILLKLQSSPPFQILESLPFSSCATTPWEPDAQGNMTSFPTQPVAAPQEPTTHSAAET